MNYLAYPNAATMPRRKHRKTERNKVYWRNYTLSRVKRNERRGR